MWYDGYVKNWGEENGKIEFDLIDGLRDRQGHMCHVGKSG
jgi:hypothetical protein